MSAAWIPRWIRSIYSVALKPDAVFYLRLGIDQLLPRVVFSRGFDYWESGMDLYPGHDMFDSFCSYQAALLTEFDRLSAEFNFQMVDAATDARTVCAHLQKNILHLLERDSRKDFILAPLQRFHHSPEANRHSPIRRSSPGSRTKHKRQWEWQRPPSPRRATRRLAVQLCNGWH